MKCKKGYRKIGGKCSKIKSDAIKIVNTPAGGSGIGFLGVLALIFITLKLIGKITWSWWWVLSPLWIPFGLGIILMILFFIFWRRN